MRNKKLFAFTVVFLMKQEWTFKIKTWEGEITQGEATAKCQDLKGEEATTATRLHYLISEWNTLWSLLIQPETHPVWSITWDTLTSCVVCMCEGEEEKHGFTCLWLSLCCDCCVECAWQQDLLMKTAIWANYLCVFSEMAQWVFPGSWHKDLNYLPISRLYSVNLLC